MSTIDFKEILDTCQVLAIINTLDPTEPSHYRSLCREYSTKFYTPLHLVLELDPEHVILNVYESRMESLEIDKIETMEALLDTVMTIEDPKYAVAKDSELEKFIEMSERQEEERLRKLANKKQASQKILLEKPDPIIENKPTSGFLDLSYLENMNNEG